MPRPKRTTEDETQLTVRTTASHGAVLQRLATRYGVSKSDLVALVVADALGLDPPAGKPTLALHPDDLAEEGSEILGQLLLDEEVSTRAA